LFSTDREKGTEDQKKNEYKTIRRSGKKTVDTCGKHTLFPKNCKKDQPTGVLTLKRE